MKYPKIGYFNGFVTLPTLFVAGYLYVFASPQYISETHFIVRGGQIAKPSVEQMIASAGAATGDANTYAVQDYIKSRDALKYLQETVNFSNIYSSKKYDAFSRFPNFYSGDGFEWLYSYYKAHVNVEQDAETFLSILRVRSFSPVDSQKIAVQLLKASERLINKMNDRGRDNLISAAQKEVNDTKDQIFTVQKKIEKFRDENNIIFPDQQSTFFIGSADSARDTLLALGMQLKTMMRVTPQNPLIDVYKRQISTIKSELDRSSGLLTNGNNSLTSKLTGYNALLLDQTILEGTLQSEEAALDAAKAEADRQQIFLEMVTIPNVADYPEYPPRLKFIIVVFLSLSTLFFIGKLIISGAREHQIT